jgi:hypothetical protein
MVRKKVRKYLVGVVFLSLIGCATTPKYRVASEYLLSTDLNIKTVFDDIVKQLEKYKYKPNKSDPEAGILIFEPRKFSYPSGKINISAQQVLYVRQEGGSVKLRLSYDCNYTGNSYEQCRYSDNDVNAKISRIEPPLVGMIKPLLTKRADKRD